MEDKTSMKRRQRGVTLNEILVSQARVPVLWIILILSAFVIIWELLPRTGMVSELSLAPPSKVAITMVSLFANFAIPKNLAVTLFEFATAYGVALFLGLGIGFVFGNARRLGELLDPFVLAGFTIPKVTLFPFFVLIFGIGTPTRVIFAAMFGFFPILLATMVALRERKEVLIKLARSMGASPLQTYVKIILPSVSLVVFAGLRLGVIATMTGVLLGEMFVATGGVGLQIMMALAVFRADIVLAYVVTVGLIAILINEMLRRMQNRLARALRL